MKIKVHKVEKDKCHKMPESLRGQQYSISSTNRLMIHMLQTLLQI